MKKVNYDNLIGLTVGNYTIFQIIYGNEHEKKLAAQRATKIRFEHDVNATIDKAHESFYRGIRKPRIGEFKPYDDNRPWVLVKCNCNNSPLYWCRIDNNIVGTHGQSCPLCKNRPRNVPDKWKSRTPGTPINYDRIDDLTGQTFKDWFVLGINNKSLDAAESHTWYDCISSLGEIDVKRGCDLRILNN